MARRSRAAAASLRVVVRGTRGSYPAARPDVLGFGGHTTCYEVRAGGHVIILDAGTGIIGLGKDLVAEYRKSREPIVATLLLSHTHHDHTQGFPFFEPLYLGSTRLYLYGPSSHYAEIDEALAQGLAAPYFPVSLTESNSMKEIESITEMHALYFEKPEDGPALHRLFKNGLPPGTPRVSVRVLKGYNHPKTGVYHYKIECGGRAIVYATDTEGFIGGDRRLIQFARGADLLIHDAQYLPSEYLDGPVPKQGWGHSTYEMACEVARQAGVKRLLLHHHDPERTDAEVEKIEAAARALFPACDAAREGAAYDL